VQQKNRDKNHPGNTFQIQFYPTSRDHLKKNNAMMALSFEPDHPAMKFVKRSEMNALIKIRNSDQLTF
jgi:hypothetical protein